MRPNIAIDGPAGAGKSTVAQGLARRLNLLYIDSGAMYRALTYSALKYGVDADAEAELTEMANRIEIRLVHNGYGRLRVFCDDEDVTAGIREPAVSRSVSKVARVPGVRLRLAQLQREMAAGGGVIMDGRDIGTFVLPDAEFKFFVTASLEVRALRRMKELEAKGFHVDFEEMKLEIAARDTIDSGREVAPLKKAEDAVLVDTTHLTADEAVECIASIVEKRLNGNV